MRDKWETSVKSFGPRHLEWETSVGDKWKTSVNSGGPRHPECETSVGDKWETSVNSCGPRQPQTSGKWETSVGDKWETSGRQVWETSVNSCGPKASVGVGTSEGDKCKLMWPKATKWETSVEDKCERQVQTHAAQGTQSGRQVWETSVNSCGPRHPE